MKKITVNYEISDLIQIEVSRYRGSRTKQIELIIGGEGKQILKGEILRMFNSLSEVKKDLNI